MPRNAKQAIDKVITKKLSRLGLKLTMKSSHALPMGMGYEARFVDPDGVIYRLSVDPEGDGWKARLDKYPYGYHGSRSRTVVVSRGEGAKVNDALNELSKK